MSGFNYSNLYYCSYNQNSNLPLKLFLLSDSTWTFLGQRLRIEHNKEGPQPIKMLHFEKLLSDWLSKIRQLSEFLNRNREISSTPEF